MRVVMPVDDDRMLELQQEMNESVAHMKTHMNTNNMKQEEERMRARLFVVVILWNNHLF